MHRWAAAILAVALAMGLAAACGTRPISTEAIEELYIGNSRSRQLMNYGEQLLAAGRYREAYTAFLAAEQAAVTEPVRTEARKRRMWLEQAIKAMEQGTTPPPPPPPPRPGIFYAPQPPSSLSTPSPPPPHPEKAPGQ